MKTTGKNGETGEVSLKFLTKMEDFMQIRWLKGPIESGGYGENGRFGKNGKTGEILPKFFMKVEDFMQMKWLNGPIESGGYGENGRFGENVLLLYTNALYFFFLILAVF